MRRVKGSRLGWLLVLAGVGLFGLVVGTSSAEGDAAQLFKKHSEHIYQIRLIDLAAEKKSALGSGFMVSSGGVLATNYHVIESAISNPDKFRIEYLGTDGSKGELKLLDVDVINDLALLRSPQLTTAPFELAAQEPQQGETIYSLGNPHDIGFTVVPGTYNGISDKSYYRRIHFSGSINSGMSGGPALDSEGRVVGINVSTAGNQISFLVPVAALQALLAENHLQPDQNMKARIRQQLFDNQNTLYGSMLAQEWPTQKLGEANVLAEMVPFVKCWGGSTDEKRRYVQVSSTCQGDEYVYLNPFFTSGTVNYQFFWMEAGELNRWQFYNLYENLFGGFVPDNRAGENDVGEFSCDEKFIKSESGGQEKVAICTRAYREYPGLFDVMFIGASVHSNNKAYVRHFSLAGVSRENSKAFMKKFMETTSWQ